MLNSNDIHALTFDVALPVDADQIVALVNMAYRGEQSRLGWTTEADLLEGYRTDREQVLALLSQPNSLFIVGRNQKQCLAVLLAQRESAQVEFSMFAVQPLLQNQGMGKALLNYAEQLVRLRWQVRKAVMQVISVREELIAFYLRRGYIITGRSRPFPVNANLWTAKVTGLNLMELEKILPTSILTDI